MFIRELKYVKVLFYNIGDELTTTIVQFYIRRKYVTVEIKGRRVFKRVTKGIKL